MIKISIIFRFKITERIESSNVTFTYKYLVDLEVHFFLSFFLRC